MMQAYLIDQPSSSSSSNRSIVLVNNPNDSTSSETVLTFSTAPNQQGRSTSAPRLIIQLTTTDQIDISTLTRLGGNVLGLVGLINVGSGE